MPQNPLAPAIPSRRQALAQLTQLACAACLMPALAHAAAAEDEGYDQDTVLRAATDFFGKTTEGLAQVIARVFREQGRPNGWIRGEEASAALTLGLRYGDGELTTKSGGSARVYWAGPSIGFDAGANASKVFTLVYGLDRVDRIYRRFPGVDGSLYWIGGVGVNYQRADGITLAPIRLGVGLRAGASIGYLSYRREKSLLPL